MPSDLHYNHWTPAIEASCAQAGCFGCNVVHRVLTGVAEITIRGDSATVQRFAEAVKPLLIELDAMRSTPQPVQWST